MKSGIYIIKNTVNGKFYIGSSKDVSRRWKTHLYAMRNNSHANKYLQNAFNKYGEDSFELIKVKDVEVDDLFLEEEALIRELNPDYNIGPVGGGNTYINLTEEERQERIEKARNASKKMWESRSEEYMAELSRKLMGEGNPNYGNNWGKEQRELASIRMKKRFDNDPSLREYYSKRMESFWRSMSEDEYKEFCGKRAESIRGENNPFYGKTHTPETIEKIKSVHKDKYESLTEDERVVAYRMKPFYIDGVLYNNLNRASIALDLSKDTIIRRLQSSSFLRYYYDDPNKKYTPKKLRVYTLHSSNCGGICFSKINDLAEYLGVCRETVRRYIKNGINKYTITVENLLLEKTHPSRNGPIIISY